MTPNEIIAHVEKLNTILDKLKEEAPSFGNYKVQIKTYQRILNDQLVMIRELAKAVEVALLPPVVTVTQPESPEKSNG